MDELLLISVYVKTTIPVGKVGVAAIDTSDVKRGTNDPYRCVSRVDVGSLIVMTAGADVIVSVVEPCMEYM